MSRVIQAFAQVSARYIIFGAFRVPKNQLVILIRLREQKLLFCDSMLFYPSIFIYDSVYL